MTGEMDDVACRGCGHPLISHRYGGANANGTYTYLSSCRRCDCEQFEDVEGAVRQEHEVRT